jgi:aspartate aminotransferase
MPVSKKIAAAMEQGSWIRRMFEEGIALKARLGADKVFDLSLGNPIMEPPAEFDLELKRLAQDPPPGMHRYMPNAGYPETRAAVATGLAAETGIPFTGDEVVMTCGAGGALNVVIKTLLDPGDEVVVFAPYFVEYFFYADNHGGVCKVVQPDSSFLPDMDSLNAALSERTRIVLVNSPNNPTGVLYPRQVLDRIADAIRTAEQRYGSEIFLVSDEPYRRILYDGHKYPDVFASYERSIVATSHSKDLGLAGERIGYIAANPTSPDSAQLVDGLVFCNRTLGFVNAPALMQRLVAGLQGATVDVAAYQAKRDFLWTELTGLGYDVVKPDGAFYLFPKSPIADDVKFVDTLRERGVLVVPGRGFGAEGYFRISYCVDDETLKGSLPGFKAALLAHSR